jgi:hypothetical protein
MSVGLAERAGAGTLDSSGGLLCLLSNPCISTVAILVYTTSKSCNRKDIINAKFKCPGCARAKLILYQGRDKTMRIELALSLINYNVDKSLWQSSIRMGLGDKLKTLLNHNS